MSPFEGPVHSLRGRYFTQRARANRDQVFATIHEELGWGAVESASGPGSTRDQTRVIRKRLPELFAQLRIRSLLDAPCGDMAWIRHMDHGLEKYYGCDLVPALIYSLSGAPPWPIAEFSVADIVSDPLPRADAVLCRDCFVHLCNTDIKSAIANFKRSGAQYLITTTFQARKNHDIRTGSWRPLNLQVPPFSLPRPIEVINEGCTEGAASFADKSLAVWRLTEL